MLQTTKRAGNAVRITALFIVAIAAACNNGNEQKKTTEDNNGHKTLAEYQQYLSTLDTTTAGNATLAAEKYKTLFTTKDSLLNDSGYSLFELYYYSLCRGINDSNVFDTIINSDVDSISLDSPDKALPFLAGPFAEIRKNGFQLEETEGYIAIVPDRSFISKHFYAFVSPAMRKYQDKIKEESNDPADEDATLLISTTQLAERAVWWEKFVAAYPTFVLINNAKELHQYYTTCLFKGLDNSLAVNPDTRAVDTSFIRAYQYVLREHPESGTAKLVGPYYEALMENDGRKAEAYLVQYKTQDILLW